mgnify:CR=1 FL=1
MSSRLLFSENQVDQMVEAKFVAKLAELKLADEPPKTVRVVRSKMIALLEETEEEIQKEEFEIKEMQRKIGEIHKDLQQIKDVLSKKQ